jgi:hypothetical protein
VKTSLVHEGSPDDRHRRVAPATRRIQLARDPRAGDRRIGDRRQTLAGEVVDHDQDAEAAGGGATSDEVERPALIRRLRQRQGCSRPGCALATTPAPNRQSLLTL